MIEKGVLLSTDSDTSVLWKRLTTTHEKEIILTPKSRSKEAFLTDEVWIISQLQQFHPGRDILTRSTKKKLAIEETSKSSKKPRVKES